MAKGKSGNKSSGGLRKNHGPKRHLFKEYKPMIHAMAKTGLFTKYSNYESFVLACNARGKRSVSRQEFVEFAMLPRDKQKDYLKNISASK